MPNVHVSDLHTCVAKSSARLFGALFRKVSFHLSNLLLRLHLLFSHQLLCCTGCPAPRSDRTALHWSRQPAGKLAPKNTQQFESVVVQVHSELYPRVHRRQQQPPQRSSSPASRATNLPTCSDDLLIRIRKSTCEVLHPCSKVGHDCLVTALKFAVFPRS